MENNEQHLEGDLVAGIFVAGALVCHLAGILACIFVASSFVCPLAGILEAGVFVAGTFASALAGVLVSGVFAVNFIMRWPKLVAKKNKPGSYTLAYN